MDRGVVGANHERYAVTPELLQRVGLIAGNRTRELAADRADLSTQTPWRTAGSADPDPCRMSRTVADPICQEDHNSVHAVGIIIIFCGANTPNPHFKKL